MAPSGLRAVVAVDAAVVTATAVEEPPPPPPPPPTSDADNAPEQLTALEKRRERARIRALRRNPPTTEAERLRRERIGAANAGKQAWNKGRRHPEETLERLRDGTRRAMASDEVKAALRAAGERRRGLSRPPETRERIGAGVRGAAAARRGRRAAAGGERSDNGDEDANKPSGPRRRTRTKKAAPSPPPPTEEQIAARRAAAAEALRERWRDPAFRARQRELADARREERAAELAARRAAAEAAGLPVPRECLTPQERRALDRRAAVEAKAAERVARAEAEARAAERAARAAAARSLVERCSAAVHELEQRAAALANDRAAAEHAKQSLAQGRATLSAATARLAELEERRRDDDDEKRVARAR